MLRKYDCSCSRLLCCGQSPKVGQPSSAELIGSVPPISASSSAPTPSVACDGQPASATATPPGANASPQCRSPPKAAPAVMCACASIQPLSRPAESTPAAAVPVTPVVTSVSA